MILAGILFILAMVAFFIFHKPKVSNIIFYKPQLLFSENELVNLINEERKLLGLLELSQEINLTGIAKQKVLEMIKTEIVDHSGFKERAQKSQSSYFSENVAYNYSTNRSLFGAYKRSENHYANMINSKTTHIGVYTENKYNCCVFAKY